jgi:hypothetical protein
MSDSSAKGIAMKWQLRGDWPVGGALIPAGTIITDDIGLPMPPPINAMALDEQSALAMAMAYEEHASICGWHHLHFAPGIDREAVFAQARHNKRWPNGMPSQNMSGRPEPPPPITAVKAEEPRSRKRR